MFKKLKLIFLLCSCKYKMVKKLEAVLRPLFQNTINTRRSKNGYTVPRNETNIRYPKNETNIRCPRIGRYKMSQNRNVLGVPKNIGQNRVSKNRTSTRCPKQERYWVSQKIGRMLNKHLRQIVQLRISTKAIIKLELGTLGNLTILKIGSLGNLSIGRQAHLAIYRN